MSRTLLAAAAGQSQATMRAESLRPTTATRRPAPRLGGARESAACPRGSARLERSARGALSPPLAPRPPSRISGRRRLCRRRGHRTGVVSGGDPGARPFRPAPAVRALAAPDHRQPGDRLRPGARRLRRRERDRRPTGRRDAGARHCDLARTCAAALARALRPSTGRWSCCATCSATRRARSAQMLGLPRGHGQLAAAAGPRPAAAGDRGGPRMSRRERARDLERELGELGRPTSPTPSSVPGA